MSDKHHQNGIYSALDKKTKSNIQLLDSLLNSLDDIENSPGSKDTQPTFKYFIDRLSLYTNAGKAYSEQLDKSLSDYRDQANFFVSLRSSCEKINSSECDDIRSQEKILRVYAYKLDQHENTSRDVQRKVAEADKRVKKMRKMRDLRKALDEMDRNIESMNYIRAELDSMEKR